MTSKWLFSLPPFRYRYKIRENSLSNFYTSSLKRNTSKTSNFARKRNHQYSAKRVKLNGKVLNPHIVYDLLEPDFEIYSLLKKKVATNAIFWTNFGLKIGEIGLLQTFIIENCFENKKFEESFPRASKRNPFTDLFEFSTLLHLRETTAQTDRQTFAHHRFIRTHKRT